MFISYVPFILSCAFIDSFLQRSKFYRLNKSPRLPSILNLWGHVGICSFHWIYKLANLLISPPITLFLTAAIIPKIFTNDLNNRVSVANVCYIFLFLILIRCSPWTLVFCPSHSWDSKGLDIFWRHWMYWPLSLRSFFMVVKKACFCMYCGSFRIPLGSYCLLYCVPAWDLVQMHRLSIHFAMRINGSFTKFDQLGKTLWFGETPC